MPQLDLTIVIPTKNDAERLSGCLQAIGKEFASEVVVVDSGSEDDTAEVVTRFDATLVQFQWNGKFPKKRNWFLRNHTPKTRWVLFLDSDEILTDAFKRELAETLPGSTASGYWLNYSIYFMGRELKHGYPLKKLALFRVGAGEYERINESRWSHLDMEIHEHPIIDGEVGHFNSKIDHRDFRDVSHYVAKHNEYSSWEARRFLQMKTLGETANPLTLKQRIKYRLIESPFAGIVYFFGAYFMMGGFLDGKRGLAFALLKMGYFTQVYCKIQELRAEPRESAETEVAQPLLVDAAVAHEPQG
ncbi:Glycosyl transferase family 2 [Stieleria maiorica]|uniref:Glycosyl transferase family 2 n=1 Tax=Stieleria maiorica TaxID=2795974 RepID=A0A5B9MNA7_9BACT|nr:glycosyltransferase family 2 protein [Stieleria maiorica]QEG01056.1 Glycosyl transferase family 2 [Stieleria maiorica]